MLFLSVDNTGCRIYISCAAVSIIRQSIFSHRVRNHRNIEIQLSSDLSCRTYRRQSCIFIGRHHICACCCCRICQFDIIGKLNRSKLGHILFDRPQKAVIGFIVFDNKMFLIPLLLSFFYIKALYRQLDLYLYYESPDK